MAYRDHNPRDRSYPFSCRSMYCGETTCPATCKHLPALNEFKAWRKRTNAIQEDPIWCPGMWTAQNP